MYNTGIMKLESNIIDAVLLKKTEIPQTNRSINRYLPTLRIFGVCSSKCPITILPKANIILTMAISNHNELVVHILIHFLVNGRSFHFSFVQRICFSKVQIVSKLFTCPRGKSLLAMCHPLDEQIVQSPITANVWL